MVCIQSSQRFSELLESSKKSRKLLGEIRQAYKTKKSAVDAARDTITTITTSAIALVAAAIPQRCIKGNSSRSL